MLRILVLIISWPLRMIDLEALLKVIYVKKGDGFLVLF